VVDQPVPAAPAEHPVAAPPPGTEYVQLTQVRVPLNDAADAFTVPDAAGRFPIVVLTGARSRVRNELVAAGLVMVVLGFIFDLNLAVRGGLVALGVVLFVLGVFQSFVVRIPEGAQALALRRGRFERTLPAGVHILPPWIAVTHVVTKREIPFAAPGHQVPTADGVRVDIDLLITFSIEAADRFVFAISAPDFDQVCQAASQDALRRLVRGMPSETVLDTAGAESDTLRVSIGVDLEGYGVVVYKVVVMAVRPPDAYMASLEARRLAVVQQAEQAETHELNRRRAADVMDLQRQREEGRREVIELDATNESRRLELLQQRLEAYPQAARWDFDSERLEVAKALAGNDRALLAIGDPSRLTDALLLGDRMDDDAGSPKAGEAGSTARAGTTARAGSTARRRSPGR
jgi:regulator of protease activity HflC (stomatin/prohibitin superfamily)